MLMAVCGFCWGLHKGDSPTLCQMLFSKSYVTQVSLNPKKFLLQGNSRGSPGWLSSIHPSSLSLHQLPAHHRPLRTQLSSTTNHPNIQPRGCGQTGDGAAPPLWDPPFHPAQQLSAHFQTPLVSSHPWLSMRSHLTPRACLAALAPAQFPVVEARGVFWGRQQRQAAVPVPQRKHWRAQGGRAALGCVYLRFLCLVRDLDGAVSL